MAYTVLARRYRSGTFDEVIGQDHVAQTLKKAIASGRIAHAYLFTGTRGVGKTSMARILAKALNCLNAPGPTTEPCGKCSSCEAIARGEDIDVIEIDAASNTGVDNVRDLIENARFRPARARFKVYIIDEVHMLSKAAFNALLKIMEEPPEHVKFILATTEAEKILPTILSRCQRYDFRNIPSKEIVAHLKRIVTDEKVDATDEALQLVARAGAGSMRDSLSLLDRLLSVGETKLSAETIERLLGMPRATLVFDLAGAIGSGDVKATLSQANAVITGGLAVDTLIGALIDHFHNLLVLNTCGASSELVDIVGVDAKELEAQAKQFDAAVLTQDISVLEELRRQMRSSQAGRALLDATLARLAMSNQFASVGELLSQLNGGAPRVMTPQKKTSDLAAGPSRSSKPSLTEIEATAEPAKISNLASSETQSTVALPHPSPLPGGEGTHAVARSSESSPSLSLPPGEGRGEGAIQDAVAKPQAASAPPWSDESIRNPQSAIDEGGDELPAVGKVAAEGATSSLWQAFAKKGTAKPAPSSRPVNGQPVPSPEPAHLTVVRQQVAQKLRGRLAGFFDAARIISLEETTGITVLWFPHDSAFAGEYVLQNIGAYAEAFEQTLNRPVRIEVQIEPAPPEPERARDERRGPKVVRPTIEEVEASTPAEQKDAPAAVDLTQFTSDPLVKAILEQFPNARVFPPR
ncbi:MAG: DNA polymerase III subunit gamma/tau [Tepidisphaeraceae bacterium]